MVQHCAVDTEAYRDAALVLLGHGSSVNAESSAPTHLHAAALRRRGLFGQVLTGFWKEEPYFSAVLRGAVASRVFVVPVFISEGYFTEEVIPRELGFAGGKESGGGLAFPRYDRRGGQGIYYCGPVGTHPSMTQVILGRAREVVQDETSEKLGEIPAPENTSLFIAGHGTGNNENSRKIIEAQVDRIRQMGEYHDVHGVFMEEPPKIEECYVLAGTSNVVVVPFFISDGLHSFEDIPVLLGEQPGVVQERLRLGKPTWVNPTVRCGKRTWYSRSVGNEPHVPDVILERVREAEEAFAAQAG